MAGLMSHPRNAIIVLGMHRSGTSSIAGSLAVLGASPPRTLMRPAEDNPKGFWESQVLTDLNDRLLGAGGSSWHDWRAFNLESAGEALSALHSEARTRIHEEFVDADLIVMKDPRICRFLPFWQKVLEDMDYRVVCISPLRSPAEVAASLMFRNEMSRSHALRLWLRHVLDAEYSSRALPRLILPWTDFLQDWRAQAPRIAKALGIRLDTSSESEKQMDEFLSADLKRQNTDEAVPDLIAQAYELLQQLSRIEDPSATHLALDHLREQFNAAAPLFADAPI